MNLSLTGRVALVTGASRGIGRATAIALAAAGADVAVNYREDAEGANETVAAIGRLGRIAKAYVASVEVYADDECMIENVVRDFGSLSILVNNAAKVPAAGRVLDAKASEVELTFRTNTFGPFFLSQLAIPHLRAHNRGDIIMITTATTQDPQPGLAAYTMSKTALETLCEILAKEERDYGIRCNVVGPGLTDTLLGRQAVRRLAGVDDIRDLDAKQPFGHVCTPEEVAAAVVYMVSDANSYGTGQKFYLDGGGWVRPSYDAEPQ